MNWVVGDLGTFPLEVCRQKRGTNEDEGGSVWPGGEIGSLLSL